MNHSPWCQSTSLKMKALPHALHAALLSFKLWSEISVLILITDLMILLSDVTLLSAFHKQHSAFNKLCQYYFIVCLEVALTFKCNAINVKTLFLNGVVYFVDSWGRPRTFSSKYSRWCKCSPNCSLLIFYRLECVSADNCYAITETFLLYYQGWVNNSTWSEGERLEPY